jgi:adenosylmethionine-8-amino-7-oxononanoate aminotransferase
LAVLDILEEEKVLDDNRRTAAYLNRRAEGLRSHPRVAHFRNTGMIWAFDVRDAKPGFAQRFYGRAINAGLLLRPLGNTVYWMPPYAIGEGEIDFLVDTLAENLDAWVD